MQYLLFEDIDQPGLNTLEVYRRDRGGYEMLERALDMEPADVLDELQASGIRGRGGAGFAMGTKASFLPKGDMDKYVVCNADESEPGTFKDRELMQKNPHLLIEGICIAAHAVGANKAFIFIRGEYDYAGRHPRGRARRGQGRRTCSATLDLWVHRGAGAYICGEETALLDALEGKRGNPRLKPPFPAVQGLYQGPTLINNVETLMNAPIILRMGGEEYAKIGTERSTGTKVVSVSGCVQRPGNYEIELGIPTREIIYGLAGGPARGPLDQVLLPRRLERRRCCPGTDEIPRPALRLRLDGQGRLDARLGRDHRRRRLRPDRRRRAQDGEVLPPRVLRQVHAVPRGHELDREDARAHRLAARPRRWTSTSWPRSATRSWATACACSATRWRCRSPR